MIPSLNGIEISVKGATSVLLGVKGLKVSVSGSKKARSQENDLPAGAKEGKYNSCN